MLDYGLEKALVRNPSREILGHFTINKAGFIMGIDLIGIGAGPANLSLAALLTTARERGLLSLSSTFLEKNSSIFWHSQQMFPGTLMQTEFYRDLVTPIDPTSRFSFLNYLKSNARPRAA